MNKPNVHFLGIAGIGSSAIASIAIANGYKVTGCDIKLHNQFTKNFDQNTLIENDNIDHLKDVEILAITPAVLALDKNNNELLAAKNKGIEVITWQEFLVKYLAQDKFIIAVTGTHGKSTTTAMIGLMLEDAGFDPTVELGAIVPNWEANYRVGNSEYLVVETDIRNQALLDLKPDITVVTNIELDHPEYYKNFNAVKKTYREFLCKTKRNVVANLSDTGIIETIGQGLDCANHKSHPVDETDYIIDYAKTLIDFPLRIPGEFNIKNASAVFHVGLLLEIDSVIIKHSLMNYRGIGRRFEFLGKYNQAEIYSDFAHHPTEIEVTLGAAREKFPNAKIVMIFQPKASSLKAFFDKFIQVFQNLPIDQIYITAPEETQEQDTKITEQFVQAINKGSIHYAGDIYQAFNNIKSSINPGEVVFFVGAKDADTLARKLVSTN